MDDSFIQLLKLLKENIMKSLNVADIAIITAIKNDDIECRLINDDALTIVCKKLENLELSKNDVVLVLYMNEDFRKNLRRIESNQSTINNEQKIFHSKSFGVIIGKIKGGVQ